MSFRTLMMVLLALSLSACFGCGMDHFGYSRWSDAGVYEQFPSAGRYDGYEVYWDATFKSASKVGKGENIGMDSFPNSSITFQIDRSNSFLSDSEAYSRVVDAYRVLGLGEAPDPGSITWLRYQYCG